MKVIAESAFNHNGDLGYLKELALASKKCGADYFTVQVMTVSSFCEENYEKNDLYKETELSHGEWKELFRFCKQKNIEVIPCTLDEKSFNLCYDFGYRLIKIHATDITNKPLLELIASKDKVMVILETQCATFVEVTLGIQYLGREKIEAIFSGFSNYPTETKELNLNSVEYLADKFNVKKGFADHSIGIFEIPIMALAKGFDYLERHITLDRNNRNYDWQVSLEPHEFKIMLSYIEKYRGSLGQGMKHPTKTELSFRSIMYKKVIEGKSELLRSNQGEFYIENLISSFDKNCTVVAIIARLKSLRLRRKVLLPFLNEELIVDLYRRLNKTFMNRVFLATSDLKEDDELAQVFLESSLNVYRGEPNSVIDRLLLLAFKEKASSIFRVTGDNPFTDPSIMQSMRSMMEEHDLDYVRVNNAPFGLVPELFSTKYLWKLYLNMDNTFHSEYLTWFVLLDNDVKAGSIEMDFNGSSYYNLSIDYKEDFDGCLDLLNSIDKKEFTNIKLKDIIDNLNTLKPVNVNKEIKLPEKQSIALLDYLNRFKEKEYSVSRKIKI
jgi:N,N'-diacetyllegionaminate synthase